MKLKTGLTLGTYAPFHRGHQFVIDTALAECETVYVMIYDDPGRTNIPLFTRANWVQQQYLQNVNIGRLRIIQCWDGPTTLGYTSEIIKLHDDYIRRVMDTHQVKPEAFYSSEKYGEHVSLGLECLNRQVDPPRIIYPVSGTAIRENPPSNRRFIAPHVHRDLVIKAVFLGAPATGKTTLAQALAKQHNTEWMPEYGREYWEKNNQNRRLTQDELLAICLGHMDREEEAIQQAEDYLFIDTNALTTRLFSIYYHGHPTGAIDECANRCVSRYDVVFLCGDDIAYEDTLDRSGDANRKMFQRMIIEDLEMRNIQYYLLHGTVEQRVDHVNKVLRQLKPRR